MSTEAQGLQARRDKPCGCLPEDFGYREAGGRKSGGQQRVTSSGQAKRTSGYCEN